MYLQLQQSVSRLATTSKYHAGTENSLGPLTANCPRRRPRIATTPLNGASGFSMTGMAPQNGALAYSWSAASLLKKRLLKYVLRSVPENLLYSAVRQRKKGGACRCRKEEERKHEKKECLLCDRSGEGIVNTGICSATSVGNPT